jgi:hypothetical protein
LTEWQGWFEEQILASLGYVVVRHIRLTVYGHGESALTLLRRCGSAASIPTSS